MNPRILSFILPLVLGTACVSQGRYDAAVADATRARSELESARAEAGKEIASQRAELLRLKEYIDQAEARCGRALAELAEQESVALSCAKALDEATALNASLRTELERRGADVDQLLATKTALSSSLEQARARLEELRRMQAAADARAAVYRDVALRLKRMIDAGELQIVLRSGRMLLVLANDVLFDSGKSKLKPRGEEALKQIAAVLATLERRRFQVAGHTDNEPIRYSGYASNWELSSARALSVVSFLIKSGMRAESLSAAGYGEFDPVRPNDNAEGMAANRRTEIALQPNIDELISLPGEAR